MHSANDKGLRVAGRIMGGDSSPKRRRPDRCDVHAGFFSATSSTLGSPLGGSNGAGDNAADTLPVAKEEERETPPASTSMRSAPAGRAVRPGASVSSATTQVIIEGGHEQTYIHPPLVGLEGPLCRPLKRRSDALLKSLSITLLAIVCRSEMSPANSKTMKLSGTVVSNDVSLQIYWSRCSPLTLAIRRIFNFNMPVGLPYDHGRKMQSPNMERTRTSTKRSCNR